MRSSVVFLSVSGKRVRAAREVKRKERDLGLGVRMGERRRLIAETLINRRNRPLLLAMARGADYSDDVFLRTARLLSRGDDFDLLVFGDNRRRFRAPVAWVIRGMRAITDRIPTHLRSGTGTRLSATELVSHIMSGAVQVGGSSGIVHRSVSVFRLPAKVVGATLGLGASGLERIYTPIYANLLGGGRSEARSAGVADDGDLEFGRGRGICRSGR